MKILLVKSENTESDVICLALESFIDGVSVVQAANPKDGIAALQGGVVFNLVIADNSFENGENSLDLFKFVRSMPRQVPFVLISSTKVELLPYFAANPPDKALARPIDISLMLEAIYSLSSGSPEVSSEYCKVAINTLLLSDEDLKADLYIKLSEEKFVRALPEGSVFDMAEYNRFIQKKVRHLYMKRETLMALAKKWMAKIDTAASEPEGFSVENVSSMIGSAHSTVQSALPLKGFTPELQKMAITSVNLAIRFIDSSPNLKELIDSLKLKKVPYISGHSTALGFMASKLAYLLGWHSEKTFFKLSLAAYLHDLTLEEDDWARLMTKQEISESGLSEAVKKKILNHPLEAAALVAEMQDVPADVAQIIEHHHELSDGSGFPRGVTNKEISQISALFVIAHDMVTEMRRLDEAFNSRAFFRSAEAKEKFERGSFSQIFRQLKAKIDEECS